MKVCIEGAARAGKSDGTSGHVRKQEGEENKAGAQNSGELVGGTSATKTHRGGHQKMLRYKAILKVLRVHRNTDGNLAGDEVPWVRAENNNDNDGV